MDSYLQIVIKIFIILIHFIGVTLVTLVILFSEDILLLGLIIICQTIVFTQLILIDGCLISKYEWFFGEGWTLTDIGKKMFFLSDGLHAADFEKMIVGIPLLLCIIKFGVMMLPKHFLSKVQKKYLSAASLRIPRNFEISVRTRI